MSFCNSVRNPLKMFVIDFHFNKKYNCREDFPQFFKIFITNFFFVFCYWENGVYSGKKLFSRTSRKKSYHANSNRRCRRRRKNRRCWWRILTGNAVAPIPTTIPEYSGILYAEKIARIYWYVIRGTLEFYCSVSYLVLGYFYRKQKSLFLEKPQFLHSSFLCKNLIKLIIRAF